MQCLGLDSGTTTCKGLVLEADCGKVLAQASAPHNCHDIPRALIEGIIVGHAQGMKRLVDLGIRADELRNTGPGGQECDHAPNRIRHFRAAGGEIQNRGGRSSWGSSSSRLDHWSSPGGIRCR
jgi:sugar (pentulose or hexulose) kinase